MPNDGSVTDAKIVVGGLSPAKITGTAVVTADARLSNARTPTAHASSHAPGGGDALTGDAAAATGSLRTLGTGAAQAASGTDSRLSDSRTPLAHAASHAPGGSDALAVDAVAATGSLRTLGSGATQAAGGTDARLSDTRTPTDATVTDAKITAGGLSPAKITGTAVVTADSRLSDSRNPLAHGSTHAPGGSDALAVDAIAATGSLRTLGSGAQQATSGTDARLSNARTPTAHASTHQPGGGDAMTVDAVAATGSLRTLGSGAQQAAGGTDSRLSDARTPTAHATTHQPGGTDALAVDAAAATGSLRTLGSGATQAAGGTDARLSDKRTPTDGTVTNGGLLWNGSAWVNAKIAAANITAGTITDTEVSGTAAIALSKIAGTAVATGDSRLSDARTPTAHAASHAFNGSDDLGIFLELATRLDLPQPREFWAGSFAPGTGVMSCAYFRPRRSFTLTTLTLVCSTAAGTGSTLQRVGFYTSNASGDITPIAHSANQATALNATGKIAFPLTSLNLDGTAGSWPTSLTLNAGQLYAFAVLGVAWSTAPTIRCIGLNSNFTDLLPPMAATKSALSDLPGGNTLAGATATLYSAMNPGSSLIVGYAT